MGQYTSYYLYQKYEERGEQEPIPCYPNVYSIDGDGTMPLVVKSSADTECGAEGTIEDWFAVSTYCVGVSKYEKQEKAISYDDGDTWVYTGEYRDELVEPHSVECGYVPPPPQYRTISGETYCSGDTGFDLYVDVYSQVSYDGGITWHTISSASTLIETDSIDCGVKYRWQPSGTTCVGYDKWEQSIRQKSYDNGETWIDVTPLETSATTLIEKNSEDCGYSPYSRWVRTSETICIPIQKYKFTYQSGRSVVGNCDASKKITSTDTQSNITAMTEAVIGDCVEEIDALAFGGEWLWYDTQPAKNMTALTISNSVKTIGEMAFSACHKLKNLTLGNSVETLNRFAFERCESLTSVTIPESVKLVRDTAFSDCSSLTSVTINSQNVYIEESAFLLANNLKRINSSTDGVYNIRACSGMDYAVFGGYSNRSYANTQLVTLNIGSGVRNLGKREGYAGNPFGACVNLSQINVDSNNPQYDSRNNCNAIIETSSGILVSGCKNTVIPNGVTEIGRQAFYAATGLTSLTLPESITKIGVEAFAYTNIQNVNVNSITIPDSAFKGITTLTSATIGNSVTKIDSDAFNGCSGLTSINIPNSVRDIRGDAFRNCRSLTSVTIGTGISEFGWPASFDGCSALTSVTIYATTPPILTADTWPFPSGCTVYVPAESLETYRNFSDVYRTHSSSIQPIP